jgi:multicomponent Na+:H+ antiporter subunit C
VTVGLLYGLGGAALVAVALYRIVVTDDLLRRLIAINVLAAGIASMLLAAAYRDDGADPVPHAFVLTGIVVLVSTTAVALVLIRKLHEEDPDDL